MKKLLEFKLQLLSIVIIEYYKIINTIKLF